MLHYLSKIRYAYKYAVCNNQLFSIVVSPDLAKHFIEMKTISIILLYNGQMFYLCSDPAK